MKPKKIATMTNSITGNKHGLYILDRRLVFFEDDRALLYKHELSPAFSFRLLNKLFTGQSSNFSIDDAGEYFNATKRLSDPLWSFTRVRRDKRINLTKIQASIVRGL